MNDEEGHTLNETPEDATSCLQQRMANNNLEEPFQAFPALLNDGIIELVEVDLAGQWRDCDAGALALEDIAEVLEV